jgi:hypothetical protein
MQLTDFLRFFETFKDFSRDFRDVTARLILAPPFNGKGFFRLFRILEAFSNILISFRESFYFPSSAQSFPKNDNFWIFPAFNVISTQFPVLSVQIRRLCP